MAENPEHGRRCVTGDCPTDIQGGTNGMIAHLKIIHVPHLTKEMIEERWSDQLWPETAAAQKARS